MLTHFKCRYRLMSPLSIYVDFDFLLLFRCVTVGESHGHTKNVPINTKMMIKREQILLIFGNFGTHWSNFGIDTDCK